MKNMEICGTTYKNVEVFEEFLIDNLKMNLDDEELRIYTIRKNLNEYLSELESQTAANGSTSYELSPFETFSRNPETIDFERIDTEVAEDEWETEIVF